MRPRRNRPPVPRSMPKPETTPNESADATEPPTAPQPATSPQTEGSNPGRSPPRTPPWSPPRSPLRTPPPGGRTGPAATKRTSIPIEQGRTSRNSTNLPTGDPQNRTWDRARPHHRGWTTTGTSLAGPSTPDLGARIFLLHVAVFGGFGELSDFISAQRKPRSIQVMCSTTSNPASRSARRTFRLARSHTVATRVPPSPRIGIAKSNHGGTSRAT